RLDRDHLEPRLAHRRRDLGPDEAQAHYDGAAAMPDGFADAIGIGHRAQIVHAGQVDTRDRESLVSSAGGDQQLIELEPLAVLARLAPTMAFVGIRIPLADRYPGREPDRP